MKAKYIFAALCILAFNAINAQNVGIGTITPNVSSLLHVDLGVSTAKGVLFTGNYTGPSVLPDLGPGSRFMFYSGRNALRAGKVDGNQWDNANIGLGSVALGYNTTANGSISTALGASTTASGVYSTAMGFATTAANNGATAMGNQTSATGDYSTTVGRNTIASGTSSTATGFFTTATGHSATSMGQYTKAKGTGSTVVGVYNDSILTTDQIFVSPGTPLFIVGNGNSVTDRSNAMVVLKNGNVGIGSNAPQSELVINGPTPEIELQTVGIAKGFMQLNGDDVRLGTYSSNDFGKVIFRLNGADRFTIFPSGNAVLTGTLTQNSDARLKTNISLISNAMQQLNKISGYHYHWRNPAADSALQSGVLAQELKEVFPELVKEDAAGMFSVNYSGLIPYMIEAAKEQQKEIAALKERLLEIELLLKPIQAKH